MLVNKAKWGKIGAAMAVILSLALPTTLDAKPQKKRGVTVTMSKAPSSIGFFTPAAADARRAAAFGRVDSKLDGSSFRFTPSSVAGSRRAVTVAIRARATTRAGAERTAASFASATPVYAGLTPSAYSLGASIGWRHFAISGELAKIDVGLLPESRESAGIGVSYSANRWNTRLMVGAERTLGMKPNVLGPEESYSVDLGGSYAVTRNLEVTGGVHYKRDRLALSNDERRDSQAIYIGTAFRF